MRQPIRCSSRYDRQLPSPAQLPASGSGTEAAAPPQERRVGRSLLAMLAMLSGLLCADLALAQTTGPTSDPLRGVRRLLPLDDIMIGYFPDNSSVGSQLLVGLGESVGPSPGVGAFGAFLNDLLGSTSNDSLGLVAGRMFALPRDTFVQAGDDLTLIVGAGAPTPSFDKWTVPLPHRLPAPVPGTAVYRPVMAMADFTGDGYDELVIGSGDLGLQVAAPVDVTDPAQGLQWGDFYGDVNTISGSALTAGDFDGDGLPEVALAYPVGGSTDLPATEFRVEIYKVDPTQLFLNFEHSVTVDTASYGQGGFAVQQLSIAAGDFDHDVSALGLPDQEIVVTASGVVAGQQIFAIQPFQVFSTLQPVAVAGQTSVPFGCPVCYQFTSAVVDSARLDWTGALEQAVVGVSALDLNFVQRSEFWIVTFDGSDQLNFEIPSMTLVEPQNYGNCTSGMRGLAIGNFNRPDSEGQPPSIPSSLGIAVLQGFNLGSEVGGDVCNSANDLPVDAYAIDPSDWSATGPSSGPSTSTQQASGQQPTFSLVAGDFQGGSLWLGPPEIVPLEDLVQLEVVLQAPPMHLDFIQPIDESNADLLNLSYGLPGFNTRFTESSGTTTSTSHQSTTSHTFAEKESLDDSVSLGVPDVASVSAELKTSSEQTQQNVVTKSSSTISTTVDSITAASDLDDRLWYTQQDVDLYLYPVLCPPDPSNPETCGTTPSHVMFSVPQSQTLYSFVPGASVEWYQPPHEVAQALSYPWTTAQLEALFPSATLDTKLEVDNLPAAGPLSTTFQWTGVGETTDSIGKTRTLSFDTSVSISTDANADIDIFSLGAKTTESFSFNTSSSTSTLNTTQTKLEGSIGFATNVPDSADLRSGSNPDYAYDFSVLVFGQTQPACPTTASNSGEASDQTCIYDARTLEETVATQGTLWAGYTIDLSDGGNWWTAPGTDYFTVHDIALAHPQRWVRDASQGTGDNCLLDASSSTELCYAPSPSSLQPSEIWTNEFYQMKGFFVLPAVSGDAGELLPPQGPQTAVINADGQVWLQARVHNYSFVATDKNGDGSAANANEVHVRFYAQEWDANNHVPLAGKSSILVDEVVLDQCIPGHSADRIAKAACINGVDDNWVLATTSQPFDPVSAGIDPGASGTYVLFWVVVWMEDGSGALVPEVTGHGLTGLPGDLASLASAGALSQSYGNNIGFFHLPTFVCPSGLDCSNINASGAPAADDAETAAPEVRIAELQVADKPIAVHAPVEVRALLEAGGVSPRSIHVALSESAADIDDRIFDVELVPYLRGDDSYLIRSNYRPDSCGPHEIRVVANPGGGRAPVTEAVSVNVSADPRVELTALRRLLAAVDLPAREHQSVARSLRDLARAFRRGRSTYGGFDDLENLRAHARDARALPATILDSIEARIDAFVACVTAAGGELAHTPRFHYRRH